jgi:sugar lactone lactonase YvrE
MSGSEPRQAEPFIDGLYFGECPRWHDGRLWFSDFYDAAVFSADEQGQRRKELDVPSEPAGLGWLPDGRLLVVSRHDRTVLRVEADGSVVEHGVLKPWATFHANDMVVSQEGRAYVGNFGFDLDKVFAGAPDAPKIAPTSLIRVDPDGTSSEAASEIAFPNGTVIFPDGATLVVAESFGMKLTAFSIAADGALTDRRVWAELAGIAPDGICLDEEGCIWVANALGTECVRVAEGGAIVDRVVTEQNCFACMLGGADRRTLFLVTAPSSDAAAAQRSREGRIVQARVDVPGAGLP